MPLLTRTALDLVKASHRGAFLLCCGLLTGLPLPVLSQGDCGPPPQVDQVEVAAVLDGDTLRLKDGRRIRLIGIDTPELGRDGSAEMPGAGEAKAALQQLVKDSRYQLYLRRGQEELDRYQRVLAHLYSRSGKKNLTAEMLEQGLGYQIAIPPNLNHLSCYREAEARARVRAAGLWRRPTQQSATLKGDETGFHILQGEIGRVGRSRSALWLNLRQGPAIRITWDDWAGFPQTEIDDLVGRKITFRGWLYLRNGEQRVRIRHPSAIDGLW